MATKQTTYVLATLPSGYDKHMIVSSQDFATLVEIFARSTGVIERYAQEKYHKVVDPHFSLRCCTDVPSDIMTEEQYEAMRKAEEMKKAEAMIPTKAEEEVTNG